MKKLIWFTTIFVLFLIFVAPALLALGIKLVPGEDQPGYDSNQRLSIYGKRDFTQKFISDGVNLSAIGTSIRNPNLKNKKDVILSLYDTNKKLIRTVVLNGQNIEDGNFVKFVFDPIADSQGKTYIFTLSTPEAGPEETIEVFFVEDGRSTQILPSWIVEYTYDQKAYSGGLPIVLYYKPGSKVEVIKEVYSSWFSRLLPQNSRKF